MMAIALNTLTGELVTSRLFNFFNIFLTSFPFVIYSSLSLYNYKLYIYIYIYIYIHIHTHIDILYIVLIQHALPIITVMATWLLVHLGTPMYSYMLLTFKNPKSPQVHTWATSIVIIEEEYWLKQLQMAYPFHPKSPVCIKPLYKQLFWNKTRILDKMLLRMIQHCKKFFLNAHCNRSTSRNRSSEAS